MSAEEKFKAMVIASESEIENFNDFADDRAIVWAAKEIADLRARLEKAEKDAERYRWLRDVGDSTWYPMSKRGITADQCDAAIDAAIAKERT